MDNARQTATTILLLLLLAQAAAQDETTTTENTQTTLENTSTTATTSSTSSSSTTTPTTSSSSTPTDTTTTTESTTTTKPTTTTTPTTTATTSTSNTTTTTEPEIQDATLTEAVGEALTSGKITGNLGEVMLKTKGGEGVRVIINLKEDRKLETKIAGETKACASDKCRYDGAMTVVKDSINSIQSKVLSQLDDKDFKVKHRYTIINSLAGNLTRKGLLKLLADPRVESVSLDEPVQAVLDESVALVNGTRPWSTFYNGRNFTGRQETVCVIDTGVRYNHDYLGDGWGNKVLGGYDYVNYDSDPNDDYGHGTHCAGIVASTHPTWGGVAPDANIVAIKVLDSGGYGYMSDVTAGIQWCTTYRTTYNISVISMSLGSSTKFTSYCDSSSTSWVVSMRNAINAAYAAGIFVVSASGNEAYTDRMSAPACFRNGTSVGAVYDYDGGSIAWSYCTDTAANVDIDKVVCFSNRPSFLDVWAPGSDITSTYYSSDTAFASMGGTSMACPHVAGAAAVLQQYSKDTTGNALTPAEIKQALVDTGNSVTRDVTKPRIDVYKAMLSLNAAPSLSDALASATECQEYVFNVTYTDINNNMPEFINVNIDGTEYDMDEANAADTDATDGKDYYYGAAVTYDSHDYNFTAGDGIYNVSTAIQSFDMSATLYLSDPAMNPEMGDTDDTITFTINYTDLCDHPPADINVSISGEHYEMAESDAGDATYTDGKRFEADVTGLSAGVKTHYFITVNDQGIVNATDEIDGPVVSAIASCTGDNPPGVGSSDDWEITQETVCVDSAFIPSASGMIVVGDRLTLNNVTIYAFNHVLNYTGGATVLNGSVIEFMD